MNNLEFMKAMSEKKDYSGVIYRRYKIHDEDRNRKYREQYAKALNKIMQGIGVNISNLNIHDTIEFKESSSSYYKNIDKLTD